MWVQSAKLPEGGETEIDALPAGPEMDRAVARALGRTDCLYNPGVGWDRHTCQTCGRDADVHVPFPKCSTDPGVAMAALERWVGQENGEYAIYHMERQQYTARLYKDFSGPHYNKHFVGMADTFALSICRAMLKAGRNKAI